MSNLDPMDVCIWQDLTRYRTNPLSAWPVTLAPLVVAGLGDYWIARRCAGFTVAKSRQVALVLAVATVFTFALYGRWSLSWTLMWLEMLLLAGMKWLVMRHAFKAAVGKREFIALMVFSAMYCLWQWAYAATHVVRF